MADLRRHTGWYRSLNLRVSETSEGENRVGYLGRLDGDYRDQPVTFRLEITEFAPYSRIASRQLEVYTARDLRAYNRAGVHTPALKIKESAYNIAFNLEPNGLGTRLTRSSEAAGQWWTLPAYLVWPMVQSIRFANQSQALKMIKSELKAAGP